MEYYIKWLNYPHSDNTWQPEEAVADASVDALKRYWQRQPESATKKKYTRHFESEEQKKKSPKPTKKEDVEEVDDDDDEDQEQQQKNKKTSSTIAAKAKSLYPDLKLQNETTSRSSTSSLSKGAHASHTNKAVSSPATTPRSAVKRLEQGSLSPIRAAATALESPMGHDDLFVRTRRPSKKPRMKELDFTPTTTSTLPDRSPMQQQKQQKHEEESSSLVTTPVHHLSRSALLKRSRSPEPTSLSSSSSSPFSSSKPLFTKKSSPTEPLHARRTPSVEPTLKKASPNQQPTGLDKSITSSPRKQTTVLDKSSTSSPKQQPTGLGATLVEREKSPQLPDTKLKTSSPPHHQHQPQTLAGYAALLKHESPRQSSQPTTPPREKSPRRSPNPSEAPVSSPYRASQYGTQSVSPLKTAADQLKMAASGSPSKREEDVWELDSTWGSGATKEDWVNEIQDVYTVEKNEKDQLYVYARLYASSKFFLPQDNCND